MKLLSDFLSPGRLKPLLSCRPLPTFRTRPFSPPPFYRRRVSPPSRHHSISAANLHFGQPLHETHPHLLAEGERESYILINVQHLADFSSVTPGISALEYHQRRQDLIRRLPANSLAILVANDVKFKSGAVFYEFHQDSNFFYLTGEWACGPMLTASLLTSIRL